MHAKALSEDFYRLTSGSCALILQAIVWEQTMAFSFLKAN
jgi:hypothetical protein